jgi:hypothetical protein
MESSHFTTSCFPPIPGTARQKFFDIVKMEWDGLDSCPTILTWLSIKMLNIQKTEEMYDLRQHCLKSLKLEPIICGDTNINYLNGNPQKIQLQSLLDTYYLVQIIDFPTRIGPTTASLIDHFFLDKNVCNKFQTHSVINWFSGHDGQILILENLQVTRKSNHVRASRDIKDENIVYFQRALQNENWQEVYN